MTGNLLSKLIRGILALGARSSRLSFLLALFLTLGAIAEARDSIQKPWPHFELSFEQGWTSEQEMSVRLILERVVATVQEGLKDVPADLRFSQSLKIKMVVESEPVAFFVNRTELGGGLEIQLNPSVLFHPDAARILAHETFHGLHSYWSPGESSWLREGLAQLFEYRLTGRLNFQNIRSLEEAPWLDLTQDISLHHQSRPLYARTMFYLFFLERECGEGTLIWNLIRPASDRDVQRLNRVLSENGTPAPHCRDFRTSRAYFEAALYFNQLSYSEGSPYQPFFLHQGLKIQSQPPLIAKGTKAALTIQGWAPFQISLTELGWFQKACKDCLFFSFQAEFPYRIDLIQRDLHVGSDRQIIGVRAPL